jgi:hypothetical protein
MTIADDARHWRARAEEARTMAEEMTTAEGREGMLGLALSCDRMAERAERLAALADNTGETGN